MCFVFIVDVLLGMVTVTIFSATSANRPLSLSEIFLVLTEAILTVILAHSVPSAVVSMIEGGATKSFDMSAISQGKVAKDTAKLGKNVATSGAGLAMGGAGLAMKGASKLYARLKGGKGSVDVKPNTAPSDSKE